jgi:MFS family permease
VRPRRTLILAACMMATATAAIEATVVATAMPTIVRELNGAELYSWVFSAYHADAGRDDPDLRPY